MLVVVNEHFFEAGIRMFRSISTPNKRMKKYHAKPTTGINIKRTTRATLRFAQNDSRYINKIPFSPSLD
jgi:hypothetical protein